MLDTVGRSRARPGPEGAESRDTCLSPTLLFIRDTNKFRGARTGWIPDSTSGDSSTSP